jgi:hypothetical protein
VLVAIAMDGSPSPISWIGVLSLARGGRSNQFRTNGANLGQVTSHNALMNLGQVTSHNALMILMTYRRLRAAELADMRSEQIDFKPAAMRVLSAACLRACLGKWRAAALRPLRTEGAG